MLQVVFSLGTDLHRTKQDSQLPCEGVRDDKFTHTNTVCPHDC